MKAVYCDWPECEHWKPDADPSMAIDERDGRCTRTLVIRMMRGRAELRSTIEDPPTCSWYTEREEEEK